MKSKYEELVLLLQDEIFKRVDKNMKSAYKKQAADRNTLLTVVGEVVVGNNVEDNVLKLDSKSRTDIKKRLDGVVVSALREQGRLEKQLIKEVLSGSAEDRFNVNSYVMSVGRSMKVKKLSSEKVADIVNKAISGKRWDKRLWDNKRGMEKVLKREIKNLVDGKTDINSVDKIIRSKYGQNAYNSKRLVNTELARVQDGANEEFAREHGIQKQVFMATLDNSTSDKCAALDGQEFDIDDSSKPDIPLHPNCRSVLVNVIDNWEPSVRKDNITKEYGNWSSYKEWLSDQ